MMTCRVIHDELGVLWTKNKRDEHKLYMKLVYGTQLLNAARDDEDDESNDVSKMAKVMDQIKLFQLHNELIMRPSNAAPVHCCSISDAGM